MRIRNAEFSDRVCGAARALRHGCQQRTRRAGSGGRAPVVGLSVQRRRGRTSPCANATLAIAALLACAASPRAGADGQEQQQPPPVAQAAPPRAGRRAAARCKRRPTPQPPDGRFSFNRVDDGFLRLDNQTGQVALCSPHAVGWACQAVPEDRAALEKEIARLQDEIAGLKAKLAALHEPPPPPRPPADRSPPPTADKSRTAQSDCDAGPRPRPRSPSRTPGAGWSR